MAKWFTEMATPEEHKVLYSKKDQSHRIRIALGLNELVTARLVAAYEENGNAAPAALLPKGNPNGGLPKAPKPLLVGAIQTRAGDLKKEGIIVDPTKFGEWRRTRSEAETAAAGSSAQDGGARGSGGGARGGSSGSARRSGAGRGSACGSRGAGSSGLNSAGCSGSLGRGGARSLGGGGVGSDRGAGSGGSLGGGAGSERGAGSSSSLGGGGAGSARSLDGGSAGSKHGAGSS